MAKTKAPKRSPQSRKTEATMINVDGSKTRDAALGRLIDALEARTIKAFIGSMKRDIALDKRIDKLAAQMRGDYAESWERCDALTNDLALLRVEMTTEARLAAAAFIKARQ